MEAKKAQFMLFSATFAKLQNPETAEIAVQELLSARMEKGWSALNLADQDRRHVEKCLEDGNYADGADALKTALIAAQKKENTMGKKATKKSTEATPAVKPVKKVKKTPDAEAAKPPVKKAVVAKSRYGHRVGSSAEFMDNQLFDGCDPDAGAKALAAKFGLDEAKAKAKLLVHVRYLKKERNIVFAVFKGDSKKLKAKTAKYTPDAK